MSKKQTYQISMECVISRYVEVEATSIDEAVSIAHREHRNVDPGTVGFDLKWADTTEHADSYGELCYEIVGLCAKCGRGVVISRDAERKWHPEWKWSYDYVGNKHDPNLVCYECGESPLKQLAELAPPLND